MNYDIYITAAAERDMAATSDYIAYVLKNPKAADDLLDETELKINALALFPWRFAPVEDFTLAAWGVRMILVKNYLVFYVISEEQHRVTIVRFLYGKSNWESILKQGFSLI